MKNPALALVFAILFCADVGAQVVFNEIHYHPVERPAFDAAGNPVFQGTTAPADFSDDVHEFIELSNPAAEAVDLSNWRIAGGVDFTFPSGTTIPAGGFLVVAKDPARIQAVYGISNVLGPYTGKLSNSGDTLRLVTPNNRGRSVQINLVPTTILPGWTPPRTSTRDVRFSGSVAWQRPTIPPTGSPCVRQSPVRRSRIFQRPARRISCRARSRSR